MISTVLLLIPAVIIWVGECIIQVAVRSTFTTVPPAGIGVWTINFFRVLFLVELKMVPGPAGLEMTGMILRNENASQNADLPCFIGTIIDRT